MSNTKQDPGTKSTLNLIVIFILIFTATFLFDAFVLHNISPAGSEFQLTDTEYADALVIYSDTVHYDFQTYLVNQNDELHLLHYEIHYISGRAELVLDEIVDPVGVHTYTAGAILGRYKFEVQNGQMMQTDYFGISNTRTTVYSPELILCTLVALPCAIVENLIYKKFFLKNGEK